METNEQLIINHVEKSYNSASIEQSLPNEFGKVKKEKIKQHKIKKNMKTNSMTSKDSLSVSPETANFIGCLQQMQTLYSSVYSSLDAIYGEETANRLINDCFYTEFEALEKCVSSFLVDSIKEKIGEIDCKEI